MNGCYYNDEIKVGEYVRMINGLIAKIVLKDKDDHFILDRYYAGGRHLTEIEVKNDIVKHSKNIIDLIEVGDYVNGKEVIGKFYEKSLKVLILDTRLNAKCRSKDIKSIVTKEQFSSVEYRLEE